MSKELNELTTEEQNVVADEIKEVLEKHNVATRGAIPGQCFLGFHKWNQGKKCVYCGKTR